MSLTFLAKSSAISWKMSFDGQVLWKRKLVVVCAVATIGAAIAPAAPTVVAALLRKRRRVANDAGRGGGLVGHVRSPGVIGAACRPAAVRRRRAVDRAYWQSAACSTSRGSPAGNNRPSDAATATASAAARPLPSPLGAAIEFPEALPVSARRDEIAAAMRDNPVVIVCGETGSGKTTQLPKIALALGRGRAHGGGLIGHTQPRRIAASSVAKRIADELKTPLGEVVGYKVRFQDRLSAGASVKLMTDGILLAETQSDPLLRAYDTIIVDEAHERSLNIDFLLGHLRQILPRRPDLRVVVTSATIDADRFAQHFAGPRRPGAGDPGLGSALSGRDPLAPVRREPRPRPRRRDLRRRRRALARAPAPRARATCSSSCPASARSATPPSGCRKHHPPGVEVLPLFARLSQQQQDEVFAPHSARRIVLATNVAETSLTVPGHPLRHRRRHGADQALQLSQQGRAAADRADQPGGGEPARRALRAGRRRHLHPPLRRGRLPVAAEVHRPGDRPLVARRRDPAHAVAQPRQRRGLPVPRGAAQARDRRRLPAPQRARRDRRPERADDDRPRARAPAARSAHRPDDPRGAPSRGAARGAGRRQRAERPGRPRPPARAAAGGRPGARQVRRRQVRVPRHAQAVALARALARRARRASTLIAQARAAAARQLHLAASRARMARHPRAAAVGRHRARLARQRERADLRAAAPVDARRPARQHRRQERRGRVVPRRARHPLLAPSRRAPGEEARALDRRRRAGRDDAALCARHRRDRRALAAAAREPSHQDAAARAALGEEGGAGGRARAGDALRHRHLRQQARRLRDGRPGRGARDLHPRGARRRRVGDEAAVRRRQPQADRAGRGARAQVAPPGRARRRRPDLRVLRPAGAGRRAQRRDVRALVPRRGQAPAQAARADARGADAPRGGGHHDGGVSEDDPPRRRRLRGALPPRARQPARRRHRDGADLRPQPGERGALRMAGPRHAQGKDRRPRQDLAAAAALAPRAAARVRRRVHRRDRVRRGQPARRARRARRQANRPAVAARRLQARAAGAAPADEPARRRRARPPARRIAPARRAEGGARRAGALGIPGARGVAPADAVVRKQRRRDAGSGRGASAERTRLAARRRRARRPSGRRPAPPQRLPIRRARPTPPGPSASCPS